MKKVSRPTDKPQAYGYWKEGDFKGQVCEVWPTMSPTKVIVSAHEPNIAVSYRGYLYSDYVSVYNISYFEVPKSKLRMMTETERALHLLKQRFEKLESKTYNLRRELKAAREVIAALDSKAHKGKQPYTMYWPESKAVRYG